MLKIEPMSISAPGCFRVATSYGERMALSGGDFPRNTARELGEALIHFAAHGTFCPEPEPPIEWREIEKDWLWHTEGWTIRYVNSHSRVYALYSRNDNTSLRDFDELRHAKAYAESRIREERKKQQ